MATAALELVWCSVARFEPEVGSRAQTIACMMFALPAYVQPGPHRRHQASLGHAKDVSKSGCASGMLRANRIQAGLACREVA